MAAPKNQPTSVFISYSRTDSATIDRLEAELISYGFRTWIDRGHLEGGDKWVAQIEHAIQASDVVVAGLSPEAIASPWVNKELFYAQQLGKPIIPVLLRQVELIPMLLVELQYIDMQTDELQGLRQLRMRLMRFGEQAADKMTQSSPPAPPYAGHSGATGGREGMQPSDTWSEQPAAKGSLWDQPSWLEENAPIYPPANPMWYDVPPKLVVNEGKEPGRNYRIRKNRITIGRSRDSDIFLEDLGVSRLHATINRQSDDRYRLRDENSANGTFVNGQRVTDHLLEDGDTIQVGETEIVFDLQVFKPDLTLFE